MKKLVLWLLIVIVLLSSIGVFSYFYGLKSTGSKKDEIEFNVDEGSNFYSIASDLKDKGLIKSKLVYKLYIKTHNVSGIEKGVYILNKGMNVKEIVRKLQGKSDNPNSVSITFKEGYNFRDFIKTIVDKTNITEEDIVNKLNDNEYLNTLINKYWFINEDILNDNLYYKLEGYLYPNTYQIDKQNVTIDYIINIMLKQTEKQLKKYKSDMENSNYSFHQLLTLASIVELEGTNKDDRSMIAQVFYNRLNNNMNIGSDVTAYYGSKVDLSERDLYVNELNDNNLYNTRNASMNGKLPVGPICNPSIESINAVLYPTDNTYIFFVSDKNGKIYYASTYEEHNSIVSELKSEGLWYEY